MTRATQTTSNTSWISSNEMTGTEEDERFRQLKTDPEMAGLIDEQGLHTVEPHEDAYQRLVVSIIRQQVSMASAEAIRDRLFDEFTVEPAAIQEADTAELEDVGLSSMKASYVRDAASVFHERGWTRDSFTGWSDERVRDELKEIRGVGDWTADMFLIFVLARPDVFPVADLGIRKAMEDLYGHDSREEMVEHSTRWQPYRTTASLYLWNHVD